MSFLNISTCMSPNMEFMCVDLADYLSEKLGQEVKPVINIPWQERETRLDKGEINFCWICGLPYVQKIARKNPNIDLLAAPVFYGERYRIQPVYFSDVVVRYDSPYIKFDDLRGTTWAINEPNSHSGSHVVRYELAKQGKNGKFFGKIIESGSHLTSLAMILRGEIDASAIDSTVLEQEISNNPSLLPKIRIIHSLGPSPVPPWVVSKNTPHELTSAVRDLVLKMHLDEKGMRLLRKGNMRMFKPVTDDDYNPIREMDKLAKTVDLLPN